MALVSPETTPLGWHAAEFSLLDTDGALHTLDSLMGEQGLVLVFMCNHCPYVVAIADRLAADARTLMAEGFGVAGINANDYRTCPEDRPERMKHYAKAWDIPFPYLFDETQDVAKTYGAVCTPDPFGFNKDGALHYRGRLGDARMGNGTNRTPDLLNAMRLIGKTGLGPDTQVPSMGCSIKWRT